MAVCGYLVMSVPGAAAEVADRVAALPGCEVVRARAHDVLLLVTDAPDAESVALRRRIEAMDGVAALVLTFGEIQRTAAASAEPGPG